MSTQGTTTSATRLQHYTRHPPSPSPQHRTRAQRPQSPGFGRKTLPAPIPRRRDPATAPSAHLGGGKGRCSPRWGCDTALPLRRKLTSARSPPPAPFIYGGTRLLPEPSGTFTAGAGGRGEGGARRGRHRPAGGRGRAARSQSQPSATGARGRRLNGRERARCPPPRPSAPPAIGSAGNPGGGGTREGGERMRGAARGGAEGVGLGLLRERG